MDRQKVAKEAIANFDKVHPNSSLEAKNFYIAGWLDGLEEFVSIVKRMREAQNRVDMLAGGEDIEFVDMLCIEQREAEREVDEWLKKMEV